MMAQILAHRSELDRERRRSLPPVHPWVACQTHPTQEHVTSLDQIPTRPPRWQYGKTTLQALKKWLRRLQWTTGGTISNIELAVDFELSSGIQLLPGPASITKRGQRMGTMLTALARLCHI